MLISIITPCFNRAEVVGEAVDSVLRQDHGEIEHIVVDGGSTDETLDVLAGYPHLHVISEQDRGVYDAINKGLDMARGDVIGLLNTDDRYQQDVFGLVSDTLEIQAAAWGVAGGARVFEVAQGEERTVAVNEGHGTKVMELESITRGAPVINARFFRRRVFEKVGRFDPDLSVAADRDFLLRAWLGGVRFVPVDPIVYHYRAHEGSLTFGGEPASETIQEYLTICKRYLSAPGVPRAMRRELVRWRAQQIGRSVRGRLRVGDLSGAGSWATRGFQLDPAWPLRFLVNGLGRQIQRFR